MASIYPTTVPSKRLAASITEASSSFQLNNILGWNGSALTSADFGSKAYGVFRNTQNTLMEIFEFDPTTIASASITILRRGLKFTGDLTTEVSANKLRWIRNETIVELGSDVPQLLKHYVTDLDDQTIAGAKTFSTAPASSAAATDPTHLVRKNEFDAAALGADVSVNRVIVSGNAGETVAAGNWLYFKSSDGEWYKTDAQDSAKSEGVLIGVAQGAGTDGNAISGGILLFGLDTNQSGRTIGAPQYLSDTDGTIGETAGTLEVTVGYAKSATSVYVNPMIGIVLISNTQTLSNKTFTSSKFIASIVAYTGAANTLALTDASKLVTVSHGSATTLTVPPNSSVAFPTGTRIMIQQIGAGQVTLAAGAGVTLQSQGTALKIVGQYGMAFLIKTATDTWAVEGNLEA